jgi:hypothetical protein
MSLSLLIAINVLADIALVAGLAHVMSRAARLEPHVASVQAAQSPSGERALAQQPEQALAQLRHPRSTRSNRPEVARPRASRVGQAGSQAAVAHE